MPTTQGIFVGSVCCAAIQATSFSSGLCARWRRRLDEMVGARWYQIRQTTPLPQTTLFGRVIGFIDRRICGRGHKRCIGTNRCNDRNSYLLARSLVAKNRERVRFFKARWPFGHRALFLFWIHLSAVEIFGLAREASGHIMLRSNMPVAKPSHAAYTTSAVGAELHLLPINWSRLDEDRSLRFRLARAGSNCAMAICKSGRRDLLQLSARMGRLGLNAEGDQDGPELRYPARQQEFRPGAGTDTRREEQSCRRHRIFRRHVRHEGKGAGCARAVQTGELGAGAGGP
jgi:hypothetical protein